MDHGGFLPLCQRKLRLRAVEATRSWVVSPHNCEIALAIQHAPTWYIWPAHTRIPPLALHLEPLGSRQQNLLRRFSIAEPECRLQPARPGEQKGAESDDDVSQQRRPLSQ